jgi:hypothetical protein
MEELFRFMLARPVQAADNNKDTVPTRPSDDYLAQLKQAKASESPHAAVKSVALAYSQSQQALRSVDTLKHAEALQKFLKVNASKSTSSLDDLASLIKRKFGAAATDVISKADFKKDLESLSDTLITNSILGRDVHVSSYDSSRLLLTMAIVERVAANDETLAEKGGVAAAYERTILLPADIFPIPGESASTNLPPKPDNEDRRAKLLAERDRLFSTYSTLTRLDPEHFTFADSSDPSGTEASMSEIRVNLPPVVATGEAEASVARSQDIPAADPGMTARATKAPLLLKPLVISAMDPKQRAVLSERGLDLTQVCVTTAVDRLSLELQSVELPLAEMGDSTHKMMTKVGETYQPLDALALEMMNGSGVLASLSVPSTFSKIMPIGVGDLLVVRQFLKRYEGRELAHIENILKGEYKERMHRRARTTEETITVETEMKREEERDQQTTERFELKTESSQIQKEEASLKVGLALSGKYGPTVEFKASTDFAMNTSKEEASKIATSYSKDITTRATNRIFERRREERILKTIEVFEEKNTHGVDNKTGARHVVGQYQWIDKIYEAQVYNYGKRMLFDIMLPEPSAFLLHAMVTQPKAGADLVKPLPFTLQPNEISEWNYAYYVKKYEVVGVSPPPQPYITVSKAFEGKGSGDDNVTKAAEIPIPDGNQAISGFVSAWYNRTSGGIVDVSLGDRMRRFSDNGAWNTAMSSQVGSIQFSMKTWRATELAVGVEIRCQRTQRALDDWKLKTHAAILQAYQKQLRDYEEKLAALQIQAAQQVQGRNPVENERLIRTELKKGATSVFTAQHYDLFGAIGLSPQGYPEPNLPEAEAEGKYIRFFEQAFEWEQMMYLFYPYYWGRKNNWLKRALLQDVDPLFAEFIKAGSVRVMVSVRPGFEKAVAHFFDTGQIWEGGDLPDISSPLYVSIIEEIRERDKAPGEEVPQGDPWDVHLPTTLLILRDQAGLPAWQKNAKGEWLPV